MNQAYHDDIRELYLKVCESLPGISSVVKAQMYKAGYCALDEPYAAWFEKLTAINNQMMSKFDDRSELVMTQLSHLYEHMSINGKTFLETYFIEGLFYGVGVAACKHYWGLLPNNLKSKYIAVHGQPPIHS